MQHFHSISCTMASCSSTPLGVEDIGHILLTSADVYLRARRYACALRCLQSIFSPSSSNMNIETRCVALAYIAAAKIILKYYPQSLATECREYLEAALGLLGDRAPRHVYILLLRVYTDADDHKAVSSLASRVLCDPSTPTRLLLAFGVDIASWYARRGKIKECTEILEMIRDCKPGKYDKFVDAYESCINSNSDCTSQEFYEIPHIQWISPPPSKLWSIYCSSKTQWYKGELSVTQHRSLLEAIRDKIMCLKGGASLDAEFLTKFMGSLSIDIGLLCLISGHLMDGFRHVFRAFSIWEIYQSKNSYIDKRWADHIWSKISFARAWLSKLVPGAASIPPGDKSIDPLLSALTQSATDLPATKLPLISEYDISDQFVQFCDPNPSSTSMFDKNKRYTYIQQCIIGRCNCMAF